MKTRTSQNYCRRLVIAGACAFALGQVACTTTHVYRPYARPHSSGPSGVRAYAPAYPSQGGYINPPREETVNFY